MMKSILATLVLLMVAPVLRADPMDDIKGCLQKVADSPDYSWTTQVTGGFARGPQEGKTQKDGFTTLSLDIRDSTFNIVMKGDKAVIKTDSGWQTAADILQSAGDNSGGPPGSEFFAAVMTRNFKTPVQQALDNVENLSNIQKTEDGYSADLSADAIKKMMARPRRNAGATTNPDAGGGGMPQPEFSNLKGSVKVTLSNGDLTQMEIHMTGTMTINGNDRDIDRTVTTTIKDVGTTKVDVPDDAKAKLGS